MNTKRRFSFFAAALAAFALTGCSPEMQTNAKVEDNLQEARRQAMIGKTSEARVWADRAIAVDPKKSQTYTGGAEAEDPSSLGQSLLGDTPQYSIAGIFTEAGDDATLISYMRDATRKFPSDLDAWEYLIMAEDRLGQKAQKTQDAKMMAAQIETMIKPQNIGKTKVDGRLMARLGQAYFDAGDEVNGEANYRKGMQTYSTDPTLPNGLAYHYAVTNNKAHLNEALTLANQALKLTKTQTAGAQQEMVDAQLAPIQDTVGWVQYRLGDYQGALMSLTDAVAGAPRVAELRYHLGMVYLAMGDKFGARTEFRHALLLNPDYAEAETQANLLQNVPPPRPDSDDGDD